MLEVPLDPVDPEPDELLEPELEVDPLPLLLLDEPEEELLEPDELDPEVLLSVLSVLSGTVTTLSLPQDLPG